MRETIAFLSIALLLVLQGKEVNCVSEIIYRVTVRDFLPAWCLNSTQYAELNIVDPILTSQPDDGPLLNCPYAAYREQDLVLGHPDFQRNPHDSGWDMTFLFDNEAEFGANAFLSGTCDQVQLAGTTTRPPNLDPAFATSDCQTRYEVYTPRFNRTTMDISPAGIPKPQHCSSDPNEVCGFFLQGGQRAYQSHTKFFQDIWYLDERRYNKRIGSTLKLKSIGGGVFEFDSLNDAENDDAPADNHYAPHGHSDYIFAEAAFPDPFLAPAWPQFDDDNRAIKNTKKYLHTSEIHTFFEYRGDESFAFSGDDDVWVYINGITAIDLGGFHGRANQAIDLSNPNAAAYLNIEVGGIYTFDFYQAERNPSASNAKLTTTLSSACNVAKAGIGKEIFPDANGNSFVRTRTVDFSFNDGDVYNNEDIELIPGGSTSISSFIFAQEQINVGTGFVVDFTFTATGSPEGFTFLLHRRPDDLTNFPLSGGANLGFKGVTHSVAFAFDLCVDRAQNTCNEQQVGIFYPELTTDENKPSLSRRRVYDPILISLKQGIEHTVKIEYFFRPNALELTIDDSLYLREFPFDPIASLDSLSAFAGFTGAVGEDAGGITITSWAMKSVDVDSTTTLPVGFNTTTEQVFQKSMTADGIEKNGYTIQTRDLCDSNIEFGGRLQNTQAKFVEERDPVTGQFAEGRDRPLVVDAEIEDGDDGTYTYNLRTLNPGIFSLYVSYGDKDKSCTFSVSVANVTNATADIVLGVSLSGVVNLATAPGSTGDGCFYGVVKNGVIVAPLTPAPTVGPTILSLPPTENDETAVFVGAIGGGTLGFCALIAALFVVVYRRRWIRDKAYIEEGKAYKLDANTKFNTNDELSRVGRDLLAARAGILRARAQRGTDKLTQELGRLETEAEELMEQVKRAKQKIQAMEEAAGRGAGAGAGAGAGGAVPKPSPQKLEF